MNISNVAKSLRGLLVLTLFVGLGACGGDAAGIPSEGCSGVLLTDEQLCKLQCKVTTQADAEALFGPPQVSVSNAAAWRYQCVSVGTGTGDLLHIQLGFSGPGGTLSTVSRSGVGKFASGKLPACLSACSF